MIPALILSIVGTATPVKVASTTWASSGVDVTFSNSLETRFASLLIERGVSVVTPRDIAVVLGIERQRQLLGCASETSCLAELGGALGVDVVLSGSVVKAGSSTTANIRAVATKDARAIFAASERLKSDDELQDWLDTTARQLAVQLAPAEASKAPSLVRWIPAAAGVVSGVIGAIFFFEGRTSADRLRTEVFASAADVQTVRARGEGQQQLGVGLLVAGAAGIAASVVWVLLSSSSPTVSIAPVSGGAVVGLSGAW